MWQSHFKICWGVLFLLARGGCMFGHKRNWNAQFQVVCLKGKCLAWWVSFCVLLWCSWIGLLLLYFASFLRVTLMPPRCGNSPHYMISRLPENIYKIVNNQSIAGVYSEQKINFFSKAKKNSIVNLFVPGQFLILTESIDWISPKQTGPSKKLSLIQLLPTVNLSCSLSTNWRIG